MKNKKTLAAIVGAGAAASLFILTPSFEGTVTKTYKDLGGVLTYCTGATEDAQWGKTYTHEECKAQLDYDLARHAEGMMKCIKVELTEGQKVAFVDLTFNIGIGNFCRSTVARKANLGDFKGSCEAILMWNKVQGKEYTRSYKTQNSQRDICLANPK